MRGVIIVETQEEFDRWMASRKPNYYAAFPDKDPNKPKIDTTGKLSDTVKVAALNK